MKIAILGDSHVAALRLGWEQIADEYPEVDVSFFAQRRDGLKDLEVQPGRLVPRSEALREAFRFTSGGLEEVQIDVYDAVLVHGLCAMPYFMNPDAVYSEQAVDQALQDTRVGRLSQDVVEKVHQAGGRRIYVGHDPLPLKRQSAAHWPRSFYKEGLRLLNRRFYTRFGARMIPQPRETMGPRCFSLEPFTQDARRLAIGDEMDNAVQPKGDVWRHMNADFGALWLRNFIRLTT